MTAREIKMRIIRVNRNKKYYEENKDRISAQKKEYRENNKDRIKEYQKNNKDRIKETQKENHLNRMKKDPLYKLGTNMRSLISSCIRRNGYTKKSRSFKILGCSFEDFLKHLDNNLYGFTYEEGIYDIDHITPISSATTEDEVIFLNHYNNFQLLPSVYNRDIKKANDWNREHFEEWLKIYQEDNEKN